jgi:hypothetical protein
MVGRLACMPPHTAQSAAVFYPTLAARVRAVAGVLDIGYARCRRLAQMPAADV